MSFRMTSPSIVWFRQDLRLEDNPALLAATAAGGPVIPVFIRATDEEGPWRPGEASDWWLHQSLGMLDKLLHKHHSKLILRTGNSLSVLLELAKETKAAAVSGIPSSMRISRTTRLGGSGAPAAVLTPHRIFGSSIPCCSRRSLMPQVTICDSGSQN
ncbi:MAG: deoxyribodipyrimidine photolyase [Schlesneria sp.]|nr:deoxyribodipyrimidine photolyase [Schlesneria sp.]